MKTLFTIIVLAVLVVAMGLNGCTEQLPTSPDQPKGHQIVYNYSTKNVEVSNLFIQYTDADLNTQIYPISSGFDTSGYVVVNTKNLPMYNTYTLIVRGYDRQRFSITASVFVDGDLTQTITKFGQDNTVIDTVSAIVYGKWEDAGHREWGDK